MFIILNLELWIFLKFVHLVAHVTDLHFLNRFLKLHKLFFKDVCSIKKHIMIRENYKND